MHLLLEFRVKLLESTFKFFNELGDLNFFHSDGASHGDIGNFRIIFDAASVVLKLDATDILFFLRYNNSSSHHSLAVEYRPQ